MSEGTYVLTLNRNCSIFNRLYNTHSHISLCIYRESSSTVECKETCQQVHTVTAPALRCALTKRAVLNMMSGATIDVLSLPFTLTQLQHACASDSVSDWDEEIYASTFVSTVSPSDCPSPLSPFFYSLMTSACLHQTQCVCKCLNVWCKWTTTRKRPYLSVYLGFNHFGSEAVGETDIGCERRITEPLILNGICISFTAHCKYYPPTTHTYHLISLRLQLVIVIQWQFRQHTNMCQYMLNPKGKKKSKIRSLQNLSSFPGEQMEILLKSLTFSDVHLIMFLLLRFIQCLFNKNTCMCS